MDILGNWNLLNSRMGEENPALMQQLFNIHMDAFDDLRKSGRSIRMNDTFVSDIAAGLDPQGRLNLAANIGRSLINASGDLMNKRFDIRHADYFPNCIFIALDAIFENLDGAINVVHPNEKMLVECVYETRPENNDPLGKLLALIGECYPWVSMTPKKLAAQSAAARSRYIAGHETRFCFKVEKLTKLDTCRTVFTGGYSEERFGSVTC